MSGAPCIHCALHKTIDDWLAAGHGDINEVFQCVGQLMADLIAECSPSPAQRDRYIAAVRRDLSKLVSERLQKIVAHGGAEHA